MTYNLYYNHNYNNDNNEHINQYRLDGRQIYKFALQTKQMLSTPLKKKELHEQSSSSNQETAHTSHFQDTQPQARDGYLLLRTDKRTPKVDYKIKTFALLDQVTELRIKEKQYESTINMLESKCREMAQQIEGLMLRSGCQTITQIANVLQAAQRNKAAQDRDNQAKKKKAERMRALYGQHSSFHENLQRQMLQQYTAATSRRIQQLGAKQKSEAMQIDEMVEQNRQLKKDLKQLKGEYMQLLRENSELKENIERLQDSLRSSIEKYEQIQNLIEDKMKVYKDTIREYEEVIQSYEGHTGTIKIHLSDIKKRQSEANYQLTEQNSIKHSGNTLSVKHQTHDEREERDSLKADFSFGKDSEDEDKQKTASESVPYFGSRPLASFICPSQAGSANGSVPKHQSGKTEQAGAQTSKGEKEMTKGQMEMSMECYRASIDGLLQQNKRLKKSFHNLFRLKQGEQLPADLLKQITIMKSIIQLNSEGAQ